MWRIMGEPGRDVCDVAAGVTRRDVLRVGGAGMVGMGLGNLLRIRARKVTPSRAGQDGIKQSIWCLFICKVVRAI